MGSLIKRTIGKEIISTVFLVTIILVVIIISTNVAKYLALAVSGKVQITTVITLIGLKLPLHVTMLLPLSMLLGVLLVLGRMAQDRELVILLASGIGYKDIYRVVLFIGVLLALLILIITWYVFPISREKSSALSESVGGGVALESLTAGKFHELKGGNRTIYIGSIDTDNKQMHKIFLRIKTNDWQHIIKADRGYFEVDAAGNKIMVFLDGTRYSGELGSLEYTIVTYKKHSLLTEKKPKGRSDPGVRSEPGANLLTRLNNRYAQAELQWRLAIPIMAIVMSVLAVSLSKTEPRFGRYSRLLPGVLIYFAYVNLLLIFKKKIEQGDINSLLGLWPIHILFLSVTMFLVWCTLRPLKS